MTMGTTIYLRGRVGYRDLLTTPTIMLPRGADVTIHYDLDDLNGLPRPVAAGEVFELAFGALSPPGYTVLRKSTAVSEEGEAVVGATYVEWYVTPEDMEDVLTLGTYAADTWMSDRTPFGANIVVIMTGRVNDNPPNGA